ncbi:hypothetical protein HYPSUDRAFT_204384 [Hypholoma sublateritium FD-334 SS-4]|uniref:Uncharacterized protein n=1 Tax=Hypholoma sublateritium (strain FD-334 SS-4) TaxID=945553 RepID=A0A0D2KYV0_HYPSF|nr:hypothetical protein HYPSUDRAFT_204384 [Hypholoma sublateritium FD-334 SS-4]
MSTSTATLTTPTPTPMHMLGRSHHFMPKFDGKPWSLKCFLTEVHNLAAEKRLTDRQAILAVLSYMPAKDHELWLSITSASGESWAMFEAELCTLYPGSEGDRKYNRKNLDALTHSSSLVPMTNHLQFGKYYRSFLTINAFLKTKKYISDQECLSKFLEGLHYRFCADLANYLWIKDPLHHINNPWVLATLYESTLFILSNRIRSASYAAMQNFPPYNDATAAHLLVKTEVFDASLLISKYIESEAFLNWISTILRPVLPLYQPTVQTPYALWNAPPTQMPHFNIHPVGNSSYNANAGPLPPQLQTQQQQRPNICIFCSDPKHYQFDCAMVADYIKQGFCMHDAANQLVTPTGLHITLHTATGRNIMEHLNNWYKNNPQALTNKIPIASTNFINVSSTTDHSATESLNPWANIYPVTIS